MERPFDHCITVLTRGQSPRVWSLVVSIFGDLAQAPGDEISGQVLGQITANLGIKPQAQRVALHRLRKDGWLYSRRAGRGSVYGLTAFGRAQSVAASPRIYGPAAPVPGCWHLLMGADSAAVAPYGAAQGYVALGAQAVLAAGPAPEAPGLLVFESAAPQIPPWLRAQICPPDLARASAQLEQDLTALSGLLRPIAALDPIESATLRVLVVHAWRRVALRAPDLPEVLFGAAWRGGACRALVAALLGRLARPQITVSGAGPDAPDSPEGSGAPGG